MMKNKHKKIFALLLIIFGLTSKTQKVYGDDCSDCVINTDSNSNAEFSDVLAGISKGSIIEEDGDECHSYCKYGVQNNAWSRVYVKAYNVFTNEKVVNIFDFSFKPLAGTSIGLNVYESKGQSEIISFDAKRRENLYACTIEYSYPCKITDEVTVGRIYRDPSSESGWGYEEVTEKREIDTTCTDTKREYLSPAGCEDAGGTLGSFYGTNECTAGAADTSYCQSALSALLNVPDTLPASYEVTYQNSNDKSTESYNNTSETVSGESDCETSSATADTYVSKSVSCSITYNRGDVCINIKNGQVSYKKEECEKEGNILLPTSDLYWRYFIPLDAKENDGLKISMNPASNGKQQSALCRKIIEENTNWYKVLVGPEKQIYDSTDKETAINDISSGCYYSTNIVIPIEQKFYNEENSKIKGYGSYFKPIDVSNPFPNGINDNSYWKGILNTTTNKLTITDANDKNLEIDLNNSFNSITYSANVTNASSIREYNKTYFYTSWENMDEDGSSDFIDDGYVKRNGTQSYYKLGCGPANANWEECK